MCIKLKPFGELGASLGPGLVDHGEDRFGHALVSVGVGVDGVALGGAVGEQLGDDLPRITSYNVCYTKLLRL